MSFAKGSSDKFFRRAFPHTTEKLGIVYTPVEIVDFILRSVNEMLQEHFGQTLGSKGVHIMDPFTGTGTFITHLLQSELIGSDEMEYKFRNEIHANEIVLLAYYIAAINIEAVYHGLSGKNDYASFEGICLTDTFQMYESDDLISHYLPDNSERRKRQKATNIQVIVGNPPYSAGQKSANDDAANTSYPELDEKIQYTYAAHSTATSKKALYDSFIRAFRWASDRIGDFGIVAYVTNSGWIDGNATNGMRACLVEEFSDLYIFNLRGNQRTSGEMPRKEGGKIFGSGSRTPVAISVLVKNPEAEERGRIFYHDIGDYLSQKDKLETIRGFGSINGITKMDRWETITPDENNDWLNHVDPSFEKFMFIGSGKRDKPSEKTIFKLASLGINSNRDSWAYNSSQQKLSLNMGKMIATYNSELENGKPLSEATTDSKMIKWSSSLTAKYERGIRGSFSEDWITTGLYRPFYLQRFYGEPMFVHRYGKFRSIFPDSECENPVIQVSGIGAKTGFSTLMSDKLPELQIVENGQCFPLYLYENSSTSSDLLSSLNDQDNGFTRRDGLTDAGLARFQTAYPEEKISKEDLFYYVYGLLHSPDYRERFKNNLAKALPRIPAVSSFDDFTAFHNAGRSLGKLHVSFEKVDPYMVTFKEGSHDLIPEARLDPVNFYRVRKMKFAGKRGDQNKTTVIYNNITMQGVPLEAYDYVVNGKPALNWVMERQCVKTDKASGIINDANDYANEVVGDPRYPMELFQRVITVSLETMEIIRGLPKLDIDS